MKFLSKLIQLITFMWIKVVNMFTLTSSKKTKSKIPGVIGLPIVGTLFDLLSAGGASKLHEYIDKRHKQYGEIFQEKLGGTQDAIFVASASLIKAVFQYEGQCPKHPLPEAWLLYNKKFKQKRGLFFMEGQEWLLYRRMLNRILLNGNLDWMKSHVNLCNRKFVETWKEESRNSPGFKLEIKNLEFQLYHWSIQVICTIMFGDEVAGEKDFDDLLNNFAKIVHRIFESSSSLMNFSPALAKFLNLRLWKVFEDSVTEVLSEGELIINSLIVKFSEEERNYESLYSRFLEENLPFDIIKRIFIDLVIAAGDTTAYTMEWALYLLSRSKEIQNTLLKECDKTNTNDVAIGLVKETLRLYPIAPFIGRYMDVDAEIGKYHIKKGTLVLLSLFTCGRDKKNFSDPLRIIPERWNSNSFSSDEYCHKSVASIPFGIGNRSCIGRRIALYQLESLLSLVTKYFELEYGNETDIQPILRLVTIPSEPLKLIVKLRQ